MLKNVKRKISLVLAFCMIFSISPIQVFANTSETPIQNFTIVNPYENVNWDTYGRYRAALHTHTTRSDGAATVGQTILDLYNKGFDIIAITDHNVTHGGDWADDYYDSLTSSQRDAIINGTFGRTAYVDFAFPGDFGPELHRPATQGGMISIPFANEQSFSEHIVTLWADFNNEPSWNQERILQETENLGGLAILAHPGRYTTGAAGSIGGLESSHNPVRISRYVELFDRFPSTLGFELFNRLDNETRSDRVLWDNVLQELMPYGRFVWGFSNDDSHSMNQAGYNFNVMLMPELNDTYAKESMVTGAFYMVTRMNRGMGPTDPEINTILPDGSPASNGGTAHTLFMLHQTTPSIANIEVGDNAITITGNDYNRIEWVADGQIIYTGPTIDLVAKQNYITTNHVRAQLVSNYGVAMTQPFGIIPEGESFLERPETNNLASIDQPLPLSVPHGAEATAASLRLPSTVMAVTERNWRVVSEVDWDTENIDFNPEDMENIQTFPVTGTITLPDNVTNYNDVPMTVVAYVTVGVDPRISIMEANAAITGAVITVEGYVTARRAGDNHRIVIQDSTDSWGGIFVQDAAGGESTAYRYVGQWVRVTGARGVQWHNNAIHSTTIDVLAGDPRGSIEPLEITLDDFDLGNPGGWNNMMISLNDVVLIERDAELGGSNLHVVRIPDEGLIDISGVLADEIQNGDLISVDRMIMHWRNDLESHRLHADWVGGTITSSTEVQAPAATPALPVAPLSSLHFVDVSEDHWAREAIHIALYNGIMSGVSSDLFDPDAPLNRAMLATMIWRLNGSPAVEYRPVFSDVAMNEWYSSAVIWAYDNNMMSGISSNLFDPMATATQDILGGYVTDGMTRAQAAAMLVN